jgi:hypothetical protein
MGITAQILPQNMSASAQNQERDTRKKVIFWKLFAALLHRNHLGRQPGCLQNNHSSSGIF